MQHGEISLAYGVQGLEDFGNLLKIVTSKHTGNFQAIKKMFKNMMLHLRAAWCRRAKETDFRENLLIYCW